MSKALLITREDIVKKTALGGNVDTDKFIQFVEIAQDTHIQNYLGTKLLKKLQSIITVGSINDLSNINYKALLEDYVKPMLIHFSLVEYLPFGAYSISNKGIYKHNSEDSTTAEKFEIDYLLSKQRSIAEHYAKRFTDYICFNSSLFPEYNQNSNGDMYPDHEVNYQGWFI